MSHNTVAAVNSSYKFQQLRLASLLILGVIFTSLGWILAWALHQDEIDRLVEPDAEPEKEHATSNVALVEPEPGETRSYHSHIVVERDAIPAY